MMPEKEPERKNPAVAPEDGQQTENKPERGEKRPFAWLHVLRWCWPLLCVVIPACLACFHVASGRQHGQMLKLSPLSLLANVCISARDYFIGTRKGASDAFWGTLTAGAVVAVLLWLAAAAFAVFLLCENVAERYAKTPEDRAKATFRLALFLPRRWLLFLFGVLRVVPFLFVWWFARVTLSRLGAGTDALHLIFDPCPVVAGVMSLLEVGLDIAERKLTA